jgi:hypothetical protein
LISEPLKKVNTRYSIELAYSADGAEPEQFFISIVAEEQAHVQTVGAVAQQLAVAIDVIEISHQNNFEEHYWVYTFISL